MIGIGVVLGNAGRGGFFSRGQPLALLPQDPGAAAVGFERRDIGHHQDPELSHGPLP